MIELPRVVINGKVYQLSYEDDDKCAFCTGSCSYSKCKFTRKGEPACVIAQKVISKEAPLSASMCLIEDNTPIEKANFNIDTNEVIILYPTST